VPAGSNRGDRSRSRSNSRSRSRSVPPLDEAELHAASMAECAPAATAAAAALTQPLAPLPARSLTPPPPPPPSCAPCRLRAGNMRLGAALRRVRAERDEMRSWYKREVKQARGERDAIRSATLRAAEAVAKANRLLAPAAAMIKEE